MSCCWCCFHAARLPQRGRWRRTWTSLITGSAGNLSWCPTSVRTAGQRRCSGTEDAPKPEPGWSRDLGSFLSRRGWSSRDSRHLPNRYLKTATSVFRGEGLQVSVGGPGKKERRRERGREKDTQRVLSAGLSLGWMGRGGPAAVDRLGWTGVHTGG